MYYLSLLIEMLVLLGSLEEKKKAQFLSNTNSSTLYFFDNEGGFTKAKNLRYQDKVCPSHLAKYTLYLNQTTVSPWVQRSCQLHKGPGAVAVTQLGLKQNSSFRSQTNRNKINKSCAQFWNFKVPGGKRGQLTCSSWIRSSACSTGMLSRANLFCSSSVWRAIHCSQWRASSKN